MVKHSAKSLKHSEYQQGFTIVELMVATMIFAVVLLILTVGVLGITHQYFKGVVETNVQTAARNAANDIAQAIQFSGGAVGSTAAGPAAGQTYGFCVGNRKYLYQLGYKVTTDNAASLGTNEAWNGPVVIDSSAVCPPAVAANYFTAAGSRPNTGGKDFLSPGMRLSELSITPLSDSLYDLKLQVTYGDDDLLNNPTAIDGSTTCKTQAGEQFCAVSQLDTVVQKRLN